MKAIVARSVIVIILALALRAAVAQQPAPPINQSLRYPLPTPPQSPPSALAPPAYSQPGVVAPTSSLAPVVNPPLTPRSVLFQPGQIMARVGDKTILYCDVAPIVNMRLEPILAKAKSPAERQAMEAAYRDPLTKAVVDQAVFNKMLLMEFERSMPSELKTDAKKRAEAEGKLKKQIRTAFDSSLNAARERIATATPEEIESLMKQDATVVRLALLMKERHLESPGELDAALRLYGTSLEQQVKDFGEYMMGMEAARKVIGGETKEGRGSKGGKKEVTHQEMLDYYQAHVADYYIPAKARFEILTSRFSNFAGDRNAAYDWIVRMGNEAVVGGTPFPAVARKHSHEPHADQGGYYDWVNPGSLASKPIDRAVFTLEVDKLSQIIEDETGFHIVHVLERKAAGQVSFQEAQPDIRKAIETQRRGAEQQKYLTALRARSKVWTIFDPPPDAPPQPAAPAQQ